MGNSFLDGWAETDGDDTGGAREYFTGGKGTAIVKDLVLKKGFKDPQTLIATFQIKKSQPTVGTPAPDAVGKTVSTIFKMTKQLGADARAIALLDAILGAEFAEAAPAQKKAQMAEVLRIGSSGYTTKGSECPAKGIEVGYEVFKTTTQSDKVIFPPSFSHVPFNVETVKANRAALDEAPAATAA